MSTYFLFLFYLFFLLLFPVPFLRFLLSGLLFLFSHLVLFPDPPVDLQFLVFLFLLHIIPLLFFVILVRLCFFFVLLIPPPLLLALLFVLLQSLSLIFFSLFYLLQVF